MLAPAEVFFVNLFIIAFFVIAVMYCCASYLLQAKHVHTLTVEAHALKNKYAKRLEAMRLGMILGVDLVSSGDDQEMVGVDIIDEIEEIAA